jgi:hypothetical protein
MTSCAIQSDWKRSSSANVTASSPRNAAATAAASAARARSACSTAATSAASAAPATSATTGVLHAGFVKLFVENKERPQADVRNFLVSEIDLRNGCGIRQRRIRSRSDRPCRVCSARRQRHRSANSSRNRYGLLQPPLIWLLLRLLGHVKTSHALLQRPPELAATMRFVLGRRTPCKTTSCKTTSHAERTQLQARSFLRGTYGRAMTVRRIRRTHFCSSASSTTPLPPPAIAARLQRNNTGASCLFVESPHPPIHASGLLSCL